jgi:hypothetical protein
MLKGIVSVLTVSAALILLAAHTPASTATGRDELALPAGVTVHEWGTFTTVAGVDGRAIEWLPLGGPNDLPCFVNYFENRLGKLAVVSNITGATRLSYDQARTVLKGTVRMETPVLYFYSPKETEVNVAVQFPHGLITEWYPKANVTQTSLTARALIDPGKATIEWNNVKVSPNGTSNFPQESGESHYYAARSTDATPVSVGGQNEKFLFYRGVGSFPVPLSAALSRNGTVAIRNLGAEPIPSAILFENRGGKIGYRLSSNLGSTVELAMPELSGSFDSLRRELEGILSAQGLFEKEAKAMVETWRDSWFEEGTRVIYVVPSHAVDSILPLEISPKPARTARVFVGRMEVLTPTMVSAVRDAFVRDDRTALAAYGRFLGPITERFPMSETMSAVIDLEYKSYVNKVSATCR